MKKKRSAILSLVLAFVLGVGSMAALSAAPTFTQDGITAVLVDGRPADVQGYNIDKLRNMAAALDVEVQWNAEDKTAHLNTDEHYKASPTELITGNWAPSTRARLETLIKENANKNRYACFDFDNTSVISDIGNALLAYQIMNLRFSMEPEFFEETLATGIPSLTQEIGRNMADESVNCVQLIKDLSANYKFLYNEYEGFKGSRTLTDIRATQEYQDFAAKLEWMYRCVGDTFDESVAYPWSIYLLSGMTSDEVYTLAKESNTFWSEFGRYSYYTLTSPTDMETAAGAVTVDIDTGVTFTDELVDLYQTLAANGIDIYVISASPVDLIRAACDQFGYGVSADNIYAMRLCTDENGRYINKYDYDWGGEGKYAQTQAAGKSQIIKNFIAPKYKGQGPVLVCGDSKGDMNMMNDWMESGDTQLGLLFNRYRKDIPTWEASVDAVEQMGKMDSKYVLQGRDENLGQLRPSEYSILKGEKDEVLVRPAA